MNILRLAANLYTTELRSNMGNSFAIHGLRDEAAHAKRDVDSQQFKADERPPEEKTNNPKPVEGHNPHKNYGSFVDATSSEP